MALWEKVALCWSRLEVMGKMNKNSMVFNDVKNFTYIIERNRFKAETVEV